MNQQFAIIGLGRFGSAVAKTLESMGYEVMGIDANTERVTHLRHELTHVVQADCTDEDQIRSLGLHNFDAVVVAVGSDLEASVLITLQLKEAGVPRVVAKASGELHGKLLRKVGADQVVFPEREMGARVAHHLLSGAALDAIELGTDYRVVEVQAVGAMFGKTLKDLNLRARYGLSIIAIRRGEEVLVNPGADDAVLEGDILVVAGDASNLGRLDDVANGG